MNMDQEFTSAFKAIAELENHLKTLNRFAVDVRDIKKDPNVEELKEEIKRLRNMINRVAVDSSGNLIQYATEPSDKVVSLAEYKDIISKKIANEILVQVIDIIANWSVNLKDARNRVAIMARQYDIIIDFIEED